MCVCVCCIISASLLLGVCDFRVLGNRSCSYLAVEELDKAREDAELACRLHRFWAKVSEEDFPLMRFVWQGFLLLNGVDDISFVMPVHKIM